MTGPDDEFDSFLRGRKPLFPRDPGDMLEPPPELDRIVLARAREAIEPAREQRVFRSPRWAAPLAMAATVVMTFSVVMHLGSPEKIVAPETGVRPVAQQYDYPAAPAAPAAKAAPAAPVEQDQAPARTDGPVVVDLATAEAQRAGEIAASREERAANQGAQYAPAPERVASEPAVEKEAAVAAADAAEVAAAVPAAPPAPVPATTYATRGMTPGDAVATALAKAEAPLADKRAPSATQARERTRDPEYRSDPRRWEIAIEGMRAAGEASRAIEEERLLHERFPNYRVAPGAPDR
jgi:hypothetical protein